MFATGTPGDERHMLLKCLALGIISVHALTVLFPPQDAVALGQGTACGLKVYCSLTWQDVINWFHIGPSRRYLIHSTLLAAGEE